MVTGPSPGTLEHGVLFYNMTGVIYDPLESTWCKCVINYHELSYCSHELRITRFARRCVYVAISASPDRRGRYMPRRISLSARLAVPNSGYLNDALAETRVCAHVHYIYIRTYEESAETWACKRTRKTRSVLIAPPSPFSLHPSAIPIFSSFLSSRSLSLYSCPLVSVCGAITSRRNHGNHAAGAESVGMQALICRAIRKVILS